MTLVVNTLSTVIANFLVRGMGIATFFISRRCLGPEQTGVWNLVQMVTGYVMAAHSGVILGAERELPFWRGKGDRVREDGARGQMFSLAAAEALIAGIGLLAFAVVCRHRYRPDLLTGFYWAALYVLLWRITECYLVSLRSLQLFVPLARAQVLLAVTDFILIAGLAYLWRLPGQFAAFALSLLVRAAVFGGLVRRRGFFTLKWVMDWKILSPLLVVGFPLVLNNFFWQWLTSIDSLVLAKRLGVTALGYYSLGMSASRATAEIPAAFATVIFPRLMHDFGAHDDDRRLGIDVYRYLKASIYLLVPAVIGAIYFGIPLVIRLFLPAFSPAVPTAKVLVLGAMFLSMTHLLMQSLSAQGKTVWISAITATGALAAFVSAWTLAGRGFFAVACAVSATYAGFFSVLALFALRRTLGMRDALRAYVVLAGGLFYSAAGVIVIDRILFHGRALPLGADVARTAAAIALSFVALGGLFWKAERDLGVIGRLKSLRGRP